MAGPIDRADALVDIDLPDPVAQGHDLLVEVKAVSVNPVDVKIRQRQSAATNGPGWKTLGWDGAGVVKAVGDKVTLFRPGDDVFYAGTVIRQGTNAQYHLVDERITGKKPKSIDWAQAAALPLTSITAWEALFDRLDVRRPVLGAANALLLIGGAGGVGSIAIQLARKLTDLTVIATASRAETCDWALAMGAHHVIDHSRPMAPQIEDLAIGAPGFVFSTTRSDQHVEDIAAIIAPQGRFLLIDDLAMFDIMPFMQKSVSVHWEMMFTRSIFETVDMAEQHRLLNAVADLVDEGKIKTTLTERLSPIDSANLKRAHAMVESGTMRGKVTLEGWNP